MLQKTTAIPATPAVHSRAFSIEGDAGSGTCTIRCEMRSRLSGNGTLTRI